MVTETLAALVAAALQEARDAGAIEGESPAPASIDFERPRKPEHGDWSTNVALGLARGGNPRSVAEQIVARLAANDVIERAEVAGPGFINLHLAATYMHGIVRAAATTGSGFGRSDIGAGMRINVEYVSSNPTGPINVVNGRHAALGDAIASLLEATGHKVTREFYVNDAGRQVRLFGQSVTARYMQDLGLSGDVPEDGYHGDYVMDIAKEIVAEHGTNFVQLEPGVRSVLIEDIARDAMLVAMKASLSRFGTDFDVWFSERTLHESKALDASLERLRESGHLEERDGALWFRSSTFGDDKDRVILRSTGEPTYLAGDIPYLADKFERGFDRLIYLWGADHHGTVARLRAAAEALGYGGDRVEVLLVQIVTLVRDDAVVKSSKRAGDIVALDELIDEVGVDAARYVFLSRSMDVPLEFDLELAAREAPENPVYYVQYAHARICSILRNAPAGIDELDPGEVDLGPLGHPAERLLMRRLDAFEETIADAARTRGPQRICRYVEELASDFSTFYRDCRVVSDDEALTRARVTLCRAARNVIASSLALLGVSAPERM